MADKIFTGRIKFYKQDLHWGFIIDSGTLKDIFFHKIELQDNYIPRLEEKVQFEIGEHKGMPVAVKIRKIQETC
jgi:cold shock CspA family protein